MNIEVSVSDALQLAKAWRELGSVVKAKFPTKAEKLNETVTAIERSAVENASLEQLKDHVLSEINSDAKINTGE